MIRPICTGALLLAQTGLLKQRRVTTHWACAELLAMRFPEITVEPDVPYMADGSLRTAAGVTPSVYRKIFIQTQQTGTNEEN
ncbi:hypothetical protein AM629_10585 [Photorhabdus heterorhabditis]|uniref:DJ-1/PfpI domain-containing protein n=1 Tax=Photorhabdus heterorhabditis TaxID=880156 RepID=A0ABR5KBW0_9GAMM|nr:hypothetical protein AM629_10585 [Photorhabdus heterorhabditis]